MKVLGSLWIGISLIMDISHIVPPDEKKSGWGWMPTTPEVLQMFDRINTLCSPTNVLEIGFFVGHSTTYMLETFDCKVTSYGMCKQFRASRDAMLTKYQDRLRIYYIQSFRIYGTHINKDSFDFALVDGSHHYEVATCDILQCIMLGIPWLLVDNTDHSDVQAALSLFDEVVDLTEVFLYNSTHKNVSKVNEARLYNVRTNDIQKLIR